jgi:membrane-bound ClpP family serine protease
LETLMLVLFGIGAGYALLTLIIGDWFGFHFHTGDLPFLSPTVIATFVTVFGGVGYLISRQTDWPVVLLIGLSVLIALTVSAAVLFLVVIPLHAAEKGSAQSAKAMIGLTGEVVTSIAPRRLGEIVYEQGGARHSAPAKSSDPGGIPQGTEVRIVGEMAGTFRVEHL